MKKNPSGWENQGRGSEECRQASRAALSGIWMYVVDGARWLVKEVRCWGVPEWLAIAMLVFAVLGGKP